MTKPVAFIDLFAGMGGFTVGAVNAGATCIVAVDNWDESCAVHRANHPTIPVTRMVHGHADHWRFFKRMVDDYQSRGYHVHIHGSPPCQALSNASTRNPEEGMPLVLWYLDMVKRCEPNSWSMENVVPVRKKLPEGTPSVVLNSADFGVPQTRRRCYAGEGWAAQPSHTKEEWVSVIDALPDLAGELVGYAPAPSMVKHFATRTPDGPYPTVTSQSPGQLKIMVNTTGGGSSQGRRVADADKPIEQPCLTIHNNTPSLRSVRLEALGSNAKRTADTPLDSPSKTICGSGNQVGPRMFAHHVNLNTAGCSDSTGEAAVAKDRPIDQPSKIIRAHHVSLRDKTDPEKPVKIRSLTLPETLVLQGFNPDYDLSAARTMKSRWTMVGNAVPPPVAEAVIRGIQIDAPN